jgi:hypothetical protein
MLRASVVLALILMAIVSADAADAHWRRNCPIPTDVPPVWGFSPIVGWQYPCQRIRDDFAPAACWRTYLVETSFGFEQRRDYICR